MSSTITISWETLDDVSDRDIFNGVILDQRDDEIYLDDPRGWLELEAKKYCLPQVQEIQGVFIPRFYGFFKGTSRFGHKTDCLVLEYAGKALPWPSKLEQKLQDKVISSAFELHAKGFKLGSMPHHVCQHPDGRILFISLAKFTTRHKCKGIQYQLRTLLVGLRLWAPSGFSCYDRQVDFSYAYPVPKVRELAQNEAPSDISRVEAVRKASEAISSHLEYYHPETYQKYEIYLDKIMSHITNSCQMSPTATLTINWEIVEPRTEHDVLPNNDLGCPSLHSNVDSVFDPVERMYSDGIECDVYRGTFRSGGNEYDAVIKIHYDGASVEGEFEAKHFCLPQIQDVQDLLIPRLYGFFQGGTYKYGMRTSCQVLEYVSKRIPWPIEDHKLQDRAFQTLCELHKRGIRHGILYDHTFQHPADGRIVFTNLSLATDKHECPSAKHPAPRGKKIWIPTEFTCYDRQVNSDYAYPKPKLDELVENEAPKNMPRLEAKRWACEAISEYLECHRPKAYKEYEEQLTNMLLQIEDEEDAPIIRENFRKLRKTKKAAARSSTPIQRDRSLTPTPRNVVRN
ncbi:hypothetical protein ABKN59_002817 [Abortiporus biennis]